MRRSNTGESGFTMIEVAIASLISMLGLIFLASLFTLSISQNRMNKQFNVTTALAQEKLEEFNAIDLTHPRMTIGGSLFTEESETVAGVEYPYFEFIFVVDPDGTVFVGDEIPAGREPNYKRFWQVEDDPVLDNTRIVSTRVVSIQAAKTQHEDDGDTRQLKNEQTTLATIRAF